MPAGEIWGVILAGLSGCGSGSRFRNEGYTPLSEGPATRVQPRLSNARVCAQCCAHPLHTSLTRACQRPQFCRPELHEN
jgi:hypothetical protein